MTFATLQLINASLHLLGTVYTAVYSPGLLTALVFYLPIGVAALRYGRRRVAEGTFARAVLGGAAVHGLVFVVAFA